MELQEHNITYELENHKSQSSREEYPINIPKYLNTSYYYLVALIHLQNIFKDRKICRSIHC